MLGFFKYEFTLNWSLKDSKVLKIGMHLSQKLKLPRCYRILRCNEYIKIGISFSSLWNWGLLCDLNSTGMGEIGTYKY